MPNSETILNSVADDKDAKDECRKKYLTIIGCFIVLMNNSVFWYWGNMTVYTSSFFVSVLNVTSGVESPWVYSSFMWMWCLGVIISGTISVRIGRRLTILLGAILFDMGVFCSHFAVQNSLAALTFTMGVAPGLGTGLMDGSALQLAVEWSGKRIALFSSILQASFSFGGLLLNQLITLYTNPRNLTPNFYLTPTKYFTQKEVLEKVPSMFLVIGCYAFCLHLIGISMLREKPASKEVNKTTSNTPENAEVAQLDKPSSNMSEKSVLMQSDKVNYDTSQDITYVQRSQMEYRGDHYRLESKDPSSEKPVAKKEEKMIPAEVANDTTEYTIKQMLRTKSFYAVWLCFFIFSLPIMLSSVYYKEFGQIWIKDDYFLTNIATLMAIVNTIVCGVLGFVVDFLGAKNCNVIATGCMAFMLFWYYFTPMVSQWLYMVTVVVFVSLSGPIFACYTTLTALLYGKKHFSTNFGLVMTSQLALNVVSPYFVGYLLTAWGWFVTYTLTGIIVSLSLIPLIVFIPTV